MIAITRQNIDELLDTHKLYAAIQNGRWYAMRRNGATKRWKRDASRIYVPFKFGFKGYGTITEADFIGTDGRINVAFYRHIDDVPSTLRP